MSSPAIVIGAMLISPLMGPILGVGFSVGINDVDTLRSSLVNFMVMVVLSILASFLFFSIPVFKDATPEILARTKPDVRDVLIAISGGLALFISISRPRPEFNTVAGVAIATALMPPLCTAGFGLATGNLNYFGGALFLFSINSTFIALAAFVITKYLHFPMVKYLNKTKRKRISQLAYTLATIIFLFSFYLFYQLFLENQYNMQAEKFVHSVKSEGVHLIGDDKDIIDYKNKTIRLYVFGSSYSPQDELRWKDQLDELGLNDTKLEILKSQNNHEVRNDIDEVKKLNIKNHKLLSTKDELIHEKDVKIQELEKDRQKYYNNEVLFKQLSAEIKINYAELDKISLAKGYVTNFKKINTLLVFSVKWSKNINKKDRKKEEQKIKKWLQTRLKLKNIEIIQMEK